MVGSSLASFSLATSAIGPKMTTGLRNPAVDEQDHKEGSKYKIFNGNCHVKQNVHIVRYKCN